MRIPLRTDGRTEFGVAVGGEGLIKVAHPIVDGRQKHLLPYVEVVGVGRLQSRREGKVAIVVSRRLCILLLAFAGLLRMYLLSIRLLQHNLRGHRQSTEQAVR